MFVSEPLSENSVVYVLMFPHILAKVDPVACELYLFSSITVQMK
jgi:hypothetical protein